MAERPGFMIYAEDWCAYSEEYTTEEIGQMIKALLAYFQTGEHTEFTDRGMRQFYRQATKAIDIDGQRYLKKCADNAYHRYIGICKRKGIEPLSREDWDEQRNLTDVDACQHLLTNLTNNNNNINLQSPITNTQSPKATVKGMQGGTPSRPPPQIAADCGGLPQSTVNHGESREQRKMELGLDW